MITIKIDHDEDTIANVASYLAEVTSWIDRGFTSGKDWSITGSDESEKEDVLALGDDDDGEEDFTGASPDNGEGR